MLLNFLLSFVLVLWLGVMLAFIIVLLIVIVVENQNYHDFQTIAMIIAALVSMAMITF